MKKLFILVFVPIFTIVFLTKAMKKEERRLLSGELFYEYPGLVPQKVPVKQRTESLILINTTKWNILVEYETKKGVKGENVLAAASNGSKPHLILDNTKQIQTLTIKPYGKVWGLARTPSWITTPENLMDKVRQARKERDFDSADIMISLPDKSLANLRSFDTIVMPVGLPQKGRLKKKESRLVPASYKIIDAFPRVAEAIRNRREILPRYVLAVPENAQLSHIDQACSQLEEQWGAEKKEYPELKAFIDAALELIQRACAALIAEIEFKDRVFLITNVSREGYKPPAK